MPIKRSGLFFTCALLLGLVAGTSLYIGQVLIQSDQVARGSLIDRLNLNGVAREEAKRYIADVNAEFQKCEFRLTGNNKTYVLSSVSIGARLDEGGYIRKVMGEENSGNILTQLIRIFRPETVAIPIKYDPAVYNAALDQAGKIIEKPAGTSRLVFDADGKPSLIAGEEGSKIDRTATFAHLPTFYRGETQFTVEAIMVPDTAELDLARISEARVLGQSTTYFNPENVNRTTNLRLAAKSLNGVIIPPGQEFSFNNVVGPRDSRIGYKEAMVIQQNEYTPGIGGGVCQVSSTLYNACLQANLPIVERHNHSVPVAYLLTGLDATVVYPVKDLRFSNNKSHPIWLQAGLSNNRLTIKIWGFRDEVQNVKIERIIKAVTAFKEVRKPDPNLPLGQEKVDHEGINGCVVECYRAVYDSEGKLLSREQLSRDTYKPLDKLVLVGTMVSLPGEADADQQVPENPSPGTSPQPPQDQPESDTGSTGVDGQEPPPSTGENPGNGETLSGESGTSTPA